jgi:hypothetical protein
MDNNKILNKRNCGAGQQEVNPSFIYIMNGWIHLFYVLFGILGIS